MLEALPVIYSFLDSVNIQIQGMRISMGDDVAVPDRPYWYEDLMTTDPHYNR